MARQVKHGTLSAATKATVTLTVKWSWIEVQNRGTGDIYFTTDGTDPASLGDDCFVVVAGDKVRVQNAKDESQCIIELISAGTPTYTVTGCTSSTGI